MSSKKIVSLQKKVREKKNSIHEQRNIFMALVDSFVSEADEQADRLLAEKDNGRFMQHYLDVMKILDQSYNSCVMLTAEAESLCDSVDLTATEMLAQEESDGEDLTSLKGATAAPYHNKALSINKTSSSCDIQEPDIIAGSTSDHMLKAGKSSSPVKKIPNYSVYDQKSANVDNLTQNYTKHTVIKSMMKSIGVDTMKDADNLETEIGSVGFNIKADGNDDLQSIPSSCIATTVYFGDKMRNEKSNQSSKMKMENTATFLETLELTDGNIDKRYSTTNNLEHDSQTTQEQRPSNKTEIGSEPSTKITLDQDRLRPGTHTSVSSTNTGTPKHVLPETKKRVESKYNKNTASKPGQPKLDTNVATRFLRGIIVQAEKDNKSLKNSKPSKSRENSQTRTNETFPVKDTIDQQTGSNLNKSNIDTAVGSKSTPDNGGTTDKTAKSQSETTKSAIIEKYFTVESVNSSQNDLAVSNTQSSVKTSIPLEMNITSDSFRLTATSIGEISLPVGRPMPVVVSETRSPWNFFIQIVNSSLEKLMQDIRVFMESEGKLLKRVEKVEEGMVYLAQFSQDQLYYRAKITDVNMSDCSPTEVDVYFIDYGNAEKRELSHLRELPVQFTSLPAQAVFCALAKIAPNNKYGVWSEQDILTFSQLANSKKFFCTLIQPNQHPDIPNIVDLFFNSTIPGNWTPTPVFVQTILINNNIGRMVTIQEQMTSFMMFYRLSPKSNYSPQSSNELTQQFGDSTGRKVRTIDLDKQESLIKKQNSIETNDICEEAESHSKESENCKLKNCDTTLLNTGVNDSQDYTEHEQNNSASGAEATDQIKAEIEVEEQSASVTDRKFNLKRDSDNQTLGTVKNSISDNKESCRDEEMKQNICDGKESCQDVEMKQSAKHSKRKENVTENQPDILTVSNSINCDQMNNNEVEVIEMTTSDIPLPNIDTSLNCYNVMLSFVKSPSHFFVHIVSEVTANTLNVMSNNINTHHSKLSRKQLQKLSKTLTPKVNDVCCAQFMEDNKFYRAQVMEIIQTPDSPQKVCENDSDSSVSGKIKVFYMDYGDVEIVPKRRLFPLPKELQNIPSLAIKSSLAHAEPVKKSKHWSADAKECFNKLTGDDKVLKMIIVDGSIEETLGSVDADPLKVVLVDNNDKEEICINVDLIKQGYAELDVKEDLKTEVGALDKFGAWDPMMEDFLSARNSYKVDVDDAGVATVGYRAQDESRICKYYNIGDCWRGDRCPYRHVEVTSDGVTLDQELVYGAVDEYYMEKILPEPGTWVAVEVTTVLNPGHFYVSLPFGKSAIDNLKEKEEIDKKDDWQMNFDQLISEMQEEYSKGSHNEDTTVDKAPGEIVAAKFTSDGKWYRARVLIVEENRLRVFFVDFGNREWLRYNCVRSILPDFLHLPFQAVECFLMHIEPLGAKYTTESKYRFKELVDNKVLVAFVKTRSFNGSIWVDLYDTTGDEDIDIAKVLLSEKLVQDTGSSTTTSSKQSHHSSQTSLILVPG
ncbi:tudor domain-containing protein 1-like [Mytilus edulis]|uniref:tudor domain-containing protein 1-like n=1 Tax=Mytilus edulis TaxID=6550 RepID=UPI0039EE1030